MEIEYDRQKITAAFRQRLGMHTGSCLRKWCDHGHGTDVANAAASTVRLEMFFDDVLDAAEKAHKQEANLVK